MPSKKDYWKNPEKHRAAANRYRLENPEWKKKSAREWAAKKRATASPDWKAKQTQYESERYKKDPEGRQAVVRKWLQDHPNYYMLKNALGRARRDSLPFDITLDDIVVPEFCPVLGIKLGDYRGQGRTGFKEDAPSLDKIIPSKGYVKGNICVISNRANWIKRDATAAELRLIADYIDRHTGVGDGS